MMLKTISFASFMLALIFLFVLIINLNIVAKTNDNIYTVEELIKISDDFDCILILGAGVKKDGSPTDMLYDRLMVGYSAFEENKSQSILISGDSEYSDYTETVTMKKVLNEKGVEDSNILCDGYGLSTYESIWRAKNVYGFQKILIVTQEYHLYRAIYIAQKLGVEAYGLDGALRTYGKQPIYNLREYLARVKDLVYAEMRPSAEYMEVWEDQHE
jgi:vancomycin permeability regulator SanA